MVGRISSASQQVMSVISTKNARIMSLWGSSSNSDSIQWVQDCWDSNAQCNQQVGSATNQQKTSRSIEPYYLVVPAWNLYPIYHRLIFPIDPSRVPFHTWWGAIDTWWMYLSFFVAAVMVSTTDPEYNQIPEADGSKYHEPWKYWKPCAEVTEQ